MKDLYNSSEVAQVRKQKFEEQGKRDTLTSLPLEWKDAVTDHNHSTHMVRSVLHRQVNAALGKIENVWKRYLSTWYNADLPTFLRQAAFYLEAEDDSRFRHPGWIKAAKAKFNKLSVAKQLSVLKALDWQGPTNNVEKRKFAFNKSILTRRFSSVTIFDVLEDALANEIKRSTDET